MNQLVEKNLSPPLGLDCCSSRTKTFAWNMSIQAPFIVMSIGVGVEIGSALVPEPVWLKMYSTKFSDCMAIASRPCCMPFLFISALPGVCIPGMDGCWGSAGFSIWRDGGVS